MFKNLRQAQLDAVLSMLNFNNPSDIINSQNSVSVSAPGTPGNSVKPLTIADPQWKVLVYDHVGQLIISPLLKVNDLREQGVTVHMPLFGDRHAITDVPAVYFVQPTHENINRLAEVDMQFSDLSRHLYESYYINFTTSVSRDLLEELASSTVQANAQSEISQVFDQYLNFISLEPNLFTLNLDSTYQTLNDPNSPDALIESVLEKITTGLFSVVATLGVVPIIRCSKGNAAEMVASALDGKLREHLMNGRNNLFADNASGPRPLLVLLDRNSDLTTMLSHTWTYSSLVHDVMEMKLGRINTVVEESGHKIKKNFDIETFDFFWQKNAGNPFPQVAEDVDSEINRYKADVEEVTKSCGVDSLEEVESDFSSNAKTLKVAITALPQLTERKRTIDMHMTIATVLLKAIQERQLDVLFSLEESITRMTKATLLETIKDPKKTAEDKLRLFIIYYLSVEDISKEDMLEYEDACVKNSVEWSAVKYVKQVRSFSKMAASTNVAPQGAISDGFLGRFGTIGSKITGRIMETGVTGGFHDLIAGVKNLLPTRKDLPATRAVEALMDGSPTDEEFLYFDPKAQRGSANAQKLKGTVFHDAIVFAVGGGNYFEYNNLQELAQRSSQKKRITYGSTNLVSPKSFLSELENLGKKQ
ncbi:Vesicle trafficking between the ER and Golgi [Nowakowskiella sp. JEL0407]|nr:Vesicle trafficking between the ER and Golgi [Nowakowskiella sp. JEL0407]